MGSDVSSPSLGPPARLKQILPEPANPKPEIQKKVVGPNRLDTKIRYLQVQNNRPPACEN